MAHRNFFLPPNTSEMDHDQVRNSFNPDARLALENGLFAMPMDNPGTSGVNPVSYYPGMPLNPNDYPSSSTGVPHYRPLTSATVDPHQQSLPLASSSSFPPSAQAHPGPCYNHCIIPNRKSPSVSVPNDRYHNMNASCEHPLPKPFPSAHPWHWDPTHVPPAHNYGGSSHAHRPHMDPRWCHNVPAHGPLGRAPPAGAWFGHAGQSYPSASSAVSAEEARHSSWQRPGPSHARATPCYAGPAFTSPADEVRQAFTRHPRSLSISGGRGAERSARSRFPYGRFQPYPTDDSHRSRWAPPEVDLDSVGLFDQHRDLRLDVDNMSYEELLALGERIGSVNTGLSEDTMSKCLERIPYSDRASDLQIGSCVICLEGYEEEDEVGTLRCGHDYHAGCVSKWLLMKNACPICKLPALDQGE